ncbi:hypothetical protein Lmac_1472 [Legionella maceachernii]|uniref:Uncharacterized protein n=1 Tax=Legionella maceachernii TaxID=466 RepID=A0A0W0W1U9_9GAMM|nr:hypothetical protein Lmac_1472 [Legionella maceachernii]SKA10837.1 hypothetical protein SAMN02745128_02116 [Legionella maceachernii]SUO99542.1 Uncharacterised protein [Legionella maceachernii]
MQSKNDVPTQGNRVLIKNLVLESPSGNLTRGRASSGKSRQNLRDIEHNRRVVNSKMEILD